MGVKCNDNRFAVYSSSFIFQLSKDLPVAHVHTIECTDGNDSVSEWGQIIYVVVYLHWVQNKCSMLNVQCSLFGYFCSNPKFPDVVIFKKRRFSTKRGSSCSYKEPRQGSLPKCIL